MRKVNDPNTSQEDKTNFLLLASQIGEKVKRLKLRIKTNPLADLSRFSNLDDLETLLRGNIPKKPPSSNKSSNSGSSSQNNSKFPNSNQAETNKD
jgi:hypothetical protein